MLHFSISCDREVAIDSFQKEEKKLNTENQGSWGNVFKNSSLCSFFILCTFYELEQRMVLFILMSGIVHEKTSTEMSV